MKRILILQICLYVSGGLFAQNTTDSTSYRRLKFKNIIAPIALISYGAFETFIENNGPENLFFNHEVEEHVTSKTSADDYIQYLPSAAVYVLNMAGIKGKNNFRDRSMILGLSALMMATTVNTMKITAGTCRPDKSAFTAFPSGHTATAFMGAELLRQEFKEVSPWIGIGGYATAFATGALRIYNNKHWFGDVCAGAGIGIISTKLAYVVHPWLKSKLFKEKSVANHLQLTPFFNGSNYGAIVRFSF